MPRILINKIQPPLKRRKSSFWYNGQIATVEDTKFNRIISVEATGHIRVCFDEQLFENEDARTYAHDKRLTDQSLSDFSKADFSNNNWFAFYEINGQEFIPLEDVAYDYDEAIRQAKHILTKYDSNDPIIEVVNSGIRVSDIIKGRRVSELYINHTRSQAKNLFIKKHR